MSHSHLFFKSLVLGVIASMLGACATSELPSATTHPSLTTNINDYKYLIGPGDNLSIFVWRNPEISGSFIVRPDGKVTTSLVEDIEVTGRNSDNAGEGTGRAISCLHK